jgi:hypothetical protein
MMKVKELIQQLKKYNNLDDEIIVAYWSYEDVRYNNEELKQEHWLELVSRFDSYDFQQTCDDVHSTLHEIREEE